MDNKRYTSILNQNGQSSVEYIMLFVVVVAMTFSILNSDSFKSYFGEQGKFATVYKNEIEFSYTNSYQGREAFETPDYSNSSHTSYQRSSGGTRFFGAAQAYPAP